jgi:hypothetical protein
MATSKKAKRKPKPKPKRKPKPKPKRKRKRKRKKAPVTKATTRRKTTTVRKKPGKNAMVARPSPKKAKPTANAAVKSTPVGPPAQPIAARLTPSATAQFALPGERIGVVTHYYSNCQSRPCG